jgi:hypothetical protein
MTVKGDEAMNHDHDAVRLRRAELDHEIDAIRTEHLLGTSDSEASNAGLVDRARQRTGRLLIAAGSVLVRPEAAASLSTRRA